MPSAWTRLVLFGMACVTLGSQMLWPDLFRWGAAFWFGFAFNSLLRWMAGQPVN